MLMKAQTTGNTGNRIFKARRTLIMKACSSASTRSKAIWYAINASSSDPLHTQTRTHDATMSRMNIITQQATWKVPYLGHHANKAQPAHPSVPSQAWVLVLGACDPPQQAEQDCCHLVSIVQEHEALADGGMVGLRHSLVQPNHQPQHLQAESIASHASCEQKMHEMPIAAGVQAGAGDQAGRPDSSRRAALVASMLLLLLYMIVPDACIASTLQSTGTAGDAAYCGYCTWVLHVPGCGTLGTPPASG
jgi:hypothetical protein